MKVFGKEGVVGRSSELFASSATLIAAVLGSAVIVPLAVVAAVSGLGKVGPKNLERPGGEVPAAAAAFSKD